MIIFPTLKSVKKAYDDKMLSEDTYKSTTKCLRSKNKEDIIFSGMFIKKDLVDHLSTNLNDEQKNILSNMLEYIYTPMDEDLKGCLLNGSAGTGKTTTMAKVVYAVSVLSPTEKICINAPTHKAIKVLAEKCSNAYDNKQIFFDTTHSALGLRVSYTADGKLKFKKGNHEPSGIGLMVIDETSMLEEELCKIILTSKSFQKTKLIFMGDVKQLPPVNTREAFLFANTDKFRIHQMNLTKIVRQVAGNPIVKYTKWLGDNLYRLKTISFNQEITDEGNGVILRGKDKLDNIINYWYSLPEAVSNPDFIRILAWTNKTVNECNLMVRKVMLNNPKDMFVKGDRIIAREQIISKGHIIAENSDEFNVKYCSIVKENRTIPFSNEIVEFEFYMIETYELDTVLYVITKNSRPLYEKYLEDVKMYCIKQQEQKHDQNVWKKYYDMVAWSAKINYSYANTIHTSQGSTYENTIVIMDDVQKNNNFIERNKLCYTAFTRAKKKLIIVQ